MLGAIGSSPFSGTIGTGASTGVLEARLAEYERQLSDRVHCSSAKTPEGKAAIRTLSDKISIVKKRIEEADSAKSAGRPTVPNIKTSANPNKDAAAPIAGIDPASAPRSPNDRVGALLDAFA